MGVIEIKHLSWILATVIYLAFNLIRIYTNKETGHGAGFGVFLGLIGTSFLYLIFWIVWSNIY
ncbi:MAG: hypothetical protein SLAVMIC_00901 [uncultured marine phage]|uniref:Transmembrane protein n=1 Tax=uncultured marine phage TaxID=707152 RepID=A0A8D9CCX0_9VIRU|nr:MAG: hypothetical protein SLAVMIC_00901 [uncultured marine phage]